MRQHCVSHMGFRRADRVSCECAEVESCLLPAVSSLAKRLLASIEDWREGTVVLEASELPNDDLYQMPPPALGNVTSQPLLALNAGVVFNTWLLFVMIVCAIALFTGSLFVSGSLTLFMLLMATAVAALQCLPAWRRSKLTQKHSTMSQL
ncbi:MAG: hypothetical protein AAFV46_00330 [Cyanobacteria bacterium J06635_11]